MLRNNINIGYRPTWAQIDLNNLAHNFFLIKKIVSQSVKIMACVKADGYGHGAVPIARKLLLCGVDWLGVASVDEAIKLRKAGINIPILVLGLVLIKDIEPLFDYNITPTVCGREFILALEKFNKFINVHVKVDTGMGRIGVKANEAFDFIAWLSKLNNIRIEGVFTHFACADVNKKLTLQQIKVFSDLVLQLKKSGINIPLVHAANSMAIIDYKESHFNMVRPGLILYGLYPKRHLKFKLKPVLSLKTKVMYVKRMEKGCGISYGHTYRVKKPANIVTLPIGYGDGYPRNLSNIGPVLIGGKKFKICGRVCMDQMMVDVGNFKVRLADEAVLIGRQNKEVISTQDLADLSDTISYEIVCGLGSRVPRIYIERDFKPKESDAEKRIFQRVPANIFLKLSDQGKTTCNAFTKDLSRNGVGLVTDKPLSNDSCVELSFQLPSDQAQLTTSGRVVWSKALANNQYVSGVSLNNIDLLRLAENLKLV